MKQDTERGFKKSKTKHLYPYFTKKFTKKIFLMYKVKNFVRETSNYFTEDRKKLEIARKYRESTENHS